MKTIYSLLICLLLFINLAKAQDILHLKNGMLKAVKVLSVDAASIKFKDFDNRYGPTLYLKKSDLLKITYENGQILLIEAPKKVVPEINDTALPTTPSNPSLSDNPEGLNTPTIPPKLRRQVIFGEILGMSGFFSVNYMPTIVSSPNGAFQIKTRVGVGMSNKSIHFPHGILFGFGSPKHQFEIGFQGAVIVGMSDGDIFEFLHSEGPGTRYSFSPTIGYRLVMENGFTFNLNFILVSAENASGIQNPIMSISTEGLSPWFGIGLGYAF